MSLFTRQPLGRPFAWLWAAFAASTFGTWIAFDAFALVAILALHAGPAAVSALAATGLAVGAVVSLPLGPWIEFRRKRPVMVAMDLIRCVALLTIPLAYALDALTLAQLLVVSVVVQAAEIAFRAASGANLKALVRRDQLMTASSRFESTTWTATMIGPPLGGAAIGLFGPVTTMIVDAASYLLSALGIRAIGGGEPEPARTERSRLRARDLLDGWRYIFAQPVLRSLFFNGMLVKGLILATMPLLSLLMLGRLHFAPWQYGLAFAAPCLGGLVGSRLARPLAARFGQHAVMLTSGTVRTFWPVGLAFVWHGAGGLLLVIGLQFGLVACMGVFTPVLATYRLEQIADDRLARTLAAWTVTDKLTIAAMTALWGLLGATIGLRAAIAAAGVLMLFTPLLLPRRRHVERHERRVEPALSSS